MMHIRVDDFPENSSRKFACGLGDGPDGRGNCFEYDAHHPDYGGLGYRCLCCHQPLTDRDNDPSR